MAGEKSNVSADTIPSFRPGTTILLIQSSSLALVGLRYMLELMNACVVAVEGSGQALDELYDNDLKPDATVVGNVLACGVTGIAAILAVRGATRNNLPAVLLTGDCDPVLLAAEAAAHGIIFLRKPIVPANLIRILVDLISKSAQS